MTPTEFNQTQYSHLEDLEQTGQSFELEVQTPRLTSPAPQSCCLPYQASHFLENVPEILDKVFLASLRVLAIGAVCLGLVVLVKLAVMFAGYT
ncbi:hypothetical protein BDV10DRAFT_182544 [Aspergillus recurvatus]